MKPRSGRSIYYGFPDSYTKFACPKGYIVYADIAFADDSQVQG